MADARMPEKFYELARPMLPAEKQPGPEGGRPPSGHYSVLKVIWFVLVTGCRWKDVPKEMGCCGLVLIKIIQEQNSYIRVALPEAKDCSAPLNTSRLRKWLTTNSPSS